MCCRRHACTRGWPAVAALSEIMTEDLFLNTLECKVAGTRLLVGDKLLAPLMFFGNSEWKHWQSKLADEIRLAASRGVHVHSLVLHFPVFGDDRPKDFSHIDEVLEYALAADPNALFFPRIPLLVPETAWWMKNHPSEMMWFTDGKSGEPSIASELWFDLCLKSLRSGLDYILANPRFASRIIGYHICSQNTGEWFYCDSRTRGVDVGPANTLAFRRWLLRKYGSAEAFSAAWRVDTDIMDAEIPIPPCNRPEEVSPVMFLDAERDRPVLDCYEFLSEMMRWRITQFAAEVKARTAGRSLVMIFYGYLWELPDPKNGHLDLKGLLECPEVDILCSPVSYLSREAGGVMQFMAPIDSVLAHNKLWMVEDDTRTWLAIDQEEEDASFNPTIRDKGLSLEVHRRNMAPVIARGIGLWWMDLWASGWLNDPIIWDNLKELVAIWHDRNSAGRRVISHDVAVVGSEDGARFFADPARHAKALMYESQLALYRSGVDFGLYLWSDLLAGRIPPCRLYIILGAQLMDQSEAVQASRVLHCNQQTVLWVSGARGVDSEKVSGFPPISDIGTDLAVKTLKNWTTILYTGLTLSPETVRFAAEIAGAHVYLRSNDAVYAGAGFLAVHAASAGSKTIMLPTRCRIFDESGKELADASEHTFEMSFGQTCYFILSENPRSQHHEPILKSSGQPGGHGTNSA